MAENLRNKISQNFTKLLVVFKKNKACSLNNLVNLEKSCYLKEQNYTKLPKLFIFPAPSSPWGIEGALELPEGQMERAKRLWNDLRPLGTREAPLERPQGSRTEPWLYLERPQRALGTREAPLDRPQGYFVLFVGRRYYLRPISSGTAFGAWNSWNAL